MNQARKQAYEAAKTQAKKRNSHLANDIRKKYEVPFDADGFPDFSDYLYKCGKSEVTIDYSGNRIEDAKRANRVAGYDRTPNGYV